MDEESFLNNLEDVFDDDQLQAPVARTYCSRCQRPMPSSCFCRALPKSRIKLRQCHCLIVQHPLELQRKNRSLPFVELSLDPSSLTVVSTRNWTYHDYDCSDQDLWVVFPDPLAIPFTQALQQRDRTKPLRLIFLDATWALAKELQRQCTFPPHAVTVNIDQLPPVLCRFEEIRTPPSPQHLSTAEAVAWTLAQVEGEPQIYDDLMKPLDCMVQQWKDFRLKQDE